MPWSSPHPSSIILVCAFFKFMKSLSILGSTGSIGVSTLDIVRQHPQLYRVMALSAGRNVTKLCEQIAEFKPELVAVQDAAAASELKSQLTTHRPEIMYGESGAIAVATHQNSQCLVSAMVGAVGLKPTYAAICQGKTVALANKETLVMAGTCMSAAVKKYNATLLPIDSEHSAILQAMQGQDRSAIIRIILTASGGPFRTRAVDTFAQITRAEALTHPNWSMGAKITIDSATMMNKGLELIEAMWLFDLPPQQIDIVVHPQSIIHSMVEYCDGAIMAQLGTPDMRGPIAYALAYPQRITSGIARLDFAKLKEMTFEAPDPDRFPALRLARSAAEVGGSMPAVMNAANEVAVAALLAERIPFVCITEIVEKTMQQHRMTPCLTIDEAIAADQWARTTAEGLL